MGKGREPEVILKTDERRIILDLGLERKFTARSGAWDDTKVSLEGDKLGFGQARQAYFGGRQGCRGMPPSVGFRSGKSGLPLTKEVRAFAIVLARPPAVPHLPSRIVRVEVQAAERLPAAMVAAFDVASGAMAVADSCAAIRAWSELPAHHDDRRAHH
jgi:hypothetical protein